MRASVPHSAGSMLRRCRPYPRYKDSGVEWLGEIPEHWEVVAFKRLGDFQAGAGFPDDEQGRDNEELPFYKVSDTNLVGNKRLMTRHNNTVSRETASMLRAYVFPKDSIIFAKVGAALLLNKRRILTRPSCIDNNMMGFVARTCDTDWVFYWLCGLDLGELANPGAVPSINEGQIREVRVPVPPPDEQRAIAAFLDRETVRIDALIEKKERQIELLQEKRVAVISHAVTRGLDPNVRMKDSGVEWLGRIPEHWNIVPIKRVFVILNGSTPKSTEPDFWDGDIPWATPDDLGNLSADTIEGTRRMITEAGYQSCGTSLAPAGSLILSTRAPIGHVAIAGIPMCTNQGCRSLVFRNRNDHRFHYYQLAVAKQELESWGQGSTFRELGRDKLASVRVVCPPLADQRAIAAFLDRETARIDAMVERIRTSIDLLREYRTALISAAVTGKVDVRKEVA